MYVAYRNSQSLVWVRLMSGARKEKVIDLKGLTKGGRSAYRSKRPAEHRGDFVQIVTQTNIGPIVRWLYGEIEEGVRMAKEK